MKRSRILSRLSMSASVIAIAATLPAMAQAQQQAQAQGLALEEIVVTARKVEENLMTVPIAITAFSADDIESLNIKQLTDIQAMTPGFHFVNQQGGSGRNDRSANNLIFRGLFLNLNTGLQAGGALFIDGAPVIGAQPPASTDVERIEVLKGPQSAYFGRSTFVGAINFITKEPGNEFKGSLRAEVSSWHSHDASLALEGPIVEDKLAARVSIRDFVRGGQYVNAADTNEKLGRQTTRSLSGTLVFTPTDDLKIKAWYNRFVDDDGAPAQFALKRDQFTQRANPDKTCSPLSAPVAAGVNPTGRAALGYWCGKLPTLSDIPASIISADYSLSNPATRNALFNPNPNWIIFDPGFNDHGGIRRKAEQASLRIDYETEAGYSFTAQTAYHNDKTQTIIDLNYRDGRDRVNPLFTAATAATRVPWMQFLLLSQGYSRDWSQEVRFSSPQDNPFRVTLGGNYFDAFTPGGPVYGIAQVGPLFTSAITRTDVTTPAVFGAAYYDLTPELTLTAEARFQWDKIKVSPKINAQGNPVVNTPAQPTIANPLKNTFKSFAPRMSLDYEYSENSTVYVLFSRGYRPGGFNSALATSPPEVIAELNRQAAGAGLTYEEERLDNYELGIKSTWLDGRARTTFTVYRDTWAGGQVGNSIPVNLPNLVPPVNNLFNVIVNNGTARLKGIEFEGQFQATEQLKLSATAGIAQTKIKTFGLGTGNCTDCFNVWGTTAGVLGNRLPTAPRVTWTGTAEYTDSLTADWDWFTRLDYSHLGKKYTDLSNIAWVGASDNVNYHLGLRREDLMIEAFVNNVTQNKTALAGLLGVDVFTFLVPPNRNEVRMSPPLPRSYGIRASYNF
jgi:iron complex outermembrane receptor protein